MTIGDRLSSMEDLADEERKKEKKGCIRNHCTMVKMSIATHPQCKSKVNYEHGGHGNKRWWFQIGLATVGPHESTFITSCSLETISEPGLVYLLKRQLVQLMAKQ